MNDLKVSIQTQDFDVAQLQRELGSLDTTGAIASFTGLVRSNNADRQVAVMELEHYPGMTERSIEKIMAEASQRWQLQAIRVVHRVGALRPGEQIVYVGVASGHRGDAFAACEFVMDYLKTRAPFWKKELTSAGEHWVEERTSDQHSAQRWGASPK
ncbi:molybdopterin synthase catalytic subunit MoaE [Halieaceae bacterium IMCC14734]|uniref:Molybdopterin synthase catalytic subunit n=1 Tax=Candidatus Litorirhabdus singularis TaxID=2518993 RepID=A0ABT3THD5_9GAMM|nr:molybdopterin synthase catalytic subunit MoaE [Candidatus Litorirhabdus singularis]MCX2981200.1 molybdopterin synthase catalytic subunit MoaE [Candidatus Litorirhabdus singularis]